MTQLHHLQASAGFARLRAVVGEDTDLSDETLAMIVEAATAFARDRLHPLNRAADQGCRLVDGRVETPDGYRAVWADMVADGWTAIDYPVEAGGQGLPLSVQTLCEEQFDKACVAFGMALGSQRGGFALLAEHAPPDLAAAWLPKIAAGEWTTTICISEVGAGSDVGRIRTLATPDGDGRWRLSGEKSWISFGDHDLTRRIGHCVLARTPGAPAGGRGLSLFLVPDTVEDADGTWRRNGVVVRRIEVKLGLHGSPTCALGFEESQAYLLGVPGRGLAQMFTMIGIMRQSVGAQGLGVAGEAADIAWRYAHERLQGGPAEAPPVPIARHADVQRMLLCLAARVEMLRGIVSELAVQMDLTRLEPDPAARRTASVLAQWLMPIAKTYGAETAAWAAGEAVQVLGGAGYTRDWPVEQLLRDSKVFSIYEGATGIQALDLLHRRLWRDKGEGLAAFVAALDDTVTKLSADHQQAAEAAAGVGRSLASAAAWLQDRSAQPLDAEASATAFLQLACLAATAWSAARLLSGADVPPREQALATYWLDRLEGGAQALEREVTAGGEALRTAWTCLSD